MGGETHQNISEAPSVAVILATGTRNITPKVIFTMGEKDNLRGDEVIAVSPDTCRGRISR